MSGPSSVVPTDLYSVEKIAAILGMTKENFEEHYIRSGKMQFSFAGNSKFVYGEWAIACIISEGIRWNEKKSNRGKSGSSTKRPQTDLSSDGEKPTERSGKGNPKQRREPRPNERQQ
jgi:hypothetical protein